MSDILDRKVFQTGEVIFKEGAEGTSAYIVQSGEVEISKIKDAGTEVLGVIGKGGVFGEMSLIDGRPRMASAKALSSATVIAVTPDMLQQKLARSDPFIRGLLKILVATVRRVQ